MSDPLPVLISIPHGGTEEPDELSGTVALSYAHVLGESDAFTDRIYDLGHRAMKVVRADVARALVDLNRCPDDLPPEAVDGVIKDVTTYGVRVFEKGKEPDAETIQSLIDRYYEPYHRRIREALKAPGLKLGIDCHSMASVGPTLAKDAGKKRPAICLGNAFGQSCTYETMHELAECFREVFELKHDEVSLNTPFAGGFITRTYGNSPIPWVQIEMSRGLYMEPPWFDRDKLKVESSRIDELNRKFEATLRLFFS